MSIATYTFETDDPRARFTWDGQLFRAVRIDRDAEDEPWVHAVRLTKRGADFKRNGWISLTLKHSLERFPKAGCLDLAAYVREILGMLAPRVTDVEQARSLAEVEHFGRGHGFVSPTVSMPAGQPTDVERYARALLDSGMCPEGHRFEDDGEGNCAACTRETEARPVVEPARRPLTFEKAINALRDAELALGEAKRGPTRVAPTRAVVDAGGVVTARVRRARQAAEAGCTGAEVMAILDGADVDADGRPIVERARLLTAEILNG